MHQIVSKAPSGAAPHSTTEGKTLNRATHAKMRAGFGHDFQNVRIHADSRAAESAQAIGAKAFTLGSDIFFGPGRYAPGTRVGDRLLAHELAHVVQQERWGAPGEAPLLSQRGDTSESEAEAVAVQVIAGQAAQVSARPQARIARDEDDKGGIWGSLVSGAGSALSAGWQGTKSAAGSVYDGYEKQTDFNSLFHGNAKEADAHKGEFGESFIRGGINGLIDSGENAVAAGNQKMVDDSKGHWYESLAKGSAWISNESTQALGGVTKGVGDIGLGLVNGIAHPIDALSGIEGIAEHDLPMVGSYLKAGHGAIDLLSGKKDGEYGDSWGSLANHVFNPMKQMEDDQKFNTKLATDIIAPDKDAKGNTDWSAWKNKPVEAATRALTNIAPIALGVGEAMAGDGVAEAASKGVTVEPPSPVSPMATTVEMPATPSPISPMATTGEIPVPKAPGVAPTVDMPATPSPGVAPTVDMPSVDPYGKTQIPSAPEPGPIKTRNPVQQMTPVNPAEVYPGAPQPPGFKSGPVMPSSVEPPVPSGPAFGTPEWGQQLPSAPPATQPGAPTMPGIGPGRTPTIPGMPEVVGPIPDPPPSVAPATKPVPYAPDGVPVPKPFEPNIPIDPPAVDPTAPTIRPPAPPPDVIAPGTQPSPGVPTQPVPSVPFSESPVSVPSFPSSEFPKPPSFGTPEWGEQLPQAPGSELPSAPPSAEIPSQPPSAPYLPDSDPGYNAYIRPYELDILRKPWKPPTDL